MMGTTSRVHDSMVGLDPATELWSQLLTNVVHIVLNARIIFPDGRDRRKVTDSFGRFHLDLDADCEAMKGLRSLSPASSNTIHLGIYYSRAPVSHVLLERYTLEFSPPSRPPAERLHHVHEEQIFQLLLRLISSYVRLLPLHSFFRRARDRGRKGRLKYFVATGTGYDIASGRLGNSGSFLGSTEMEKEKEGAVSIQFEDRYESKSFPLARTAEHGTFSLTVQHTTSIPSEVDYESAIVTIPDYWTPARSSPSVQPPVTRTISSPSINFTHNEAATTRCDSFGAPPRDSASSTTPPVKIPKGPSMTYSGTPPPPFAATPTPSSLQSNQSFSRVYHGMLRPDSTGRSSVNSSSPSQDTASQWAPRVDAANGAQAPGSYHPVTAWTRSHTTPPANQVIWPPRKPVTQSSLSALQDLSSSVAFLDDDCDRDSEDSTCEGTDDEVSRFMDRMENVTLEGGFGSSLEHSAAWTPPSYKVKDLKSQLLDLKNDFFAVVQGPGSPPTFRK